MKKVKQTLEQFGGMSAKKKTLVRVIEVEDNIAVDGVEVDKKTPTHDWTEVTEENGS